MIVSFKKEDSSEGGNKAKNRLSGERVAPNVVRVKNEHFPHASAKRMPGLLEQDKSNAIVAPVSTVC